MVAVAFQHLAILVPAWSHLVQNYHMMAYLKSYLLEREVQCLQVAFHAVPANGRVESGAYLRAGAVKK